MSFHPVRFKLSIESSNWIWIHSDFLFESLDQWRWCDWISSESKLSSRRLNMFLTRWSTSWTHQTVELVWRWSAVIDLIWWEVELGDCDWCEVISCYRVEPPSLTADLWLSSDKTTWSRRSVWQLTGSCCLKLFHLLITRSRDGRFTPDAPYQDFISYIFCICYM